MAQTLGRGLRQKKRSKKLRESLESQDTEKESEPPTSTVPMASTASNGPTVPPPASNNASNIGKLRAVSLDRTVKCDGATYTLPLFENIPTLIYDWPAPRPKVKQGSILPLSARHRSFKAQQDAGERASYSTEPPIDEWEMFAWNFVRGGGDCQDNAGTFEMAVGVFVTRAKRAYYTNRSWAQFETQELAARSEEAELPNAIRLAIFDRLKVRLCEELWLQPYGAAADSKVPSPEREVQYVPAPSASGQTSTPGYHGPPVPKRQRVSGPVMGAQRAVSGNGGPVSATHTASRAGSADTPSSEAQITGWHRDRWGTYQPLYENETEAPSMDRLLVASHADRETDHAVLRQGNTSMARLRDELRASHINGVRVASQPNFLPSFDTSVELNQLDMETSDEEDEDDKVRFIVTR